MQQKAPNFQRVLILQGDGSLGATTLAGPTSKLSNLTFAQFQLQTQVPPNQHHLPIPGQPTVRQQPSTSAPNARLSVEALETSASVPVGQAAEAIINCPSNFPFPTGGGYDMDGAIPETFFITYNGPFPAPSVSPTPTGWQVEAFNADPNHQDRVITASVICAK